MNKINNIRVKIDRRRAEESLEYFRRNAIVGENGKVSFRVSPEETLARQLLYASVSISVEIPEETKARIVNLALSRCQLAPEYERARDLINSFKQNFIEVYNEFQGNKSYFKCLTFLNLDVQPPCHFQILDIEANFITWEELENSFELYPLWKEVYKRQTLFSFPYKFVTKLTDGLKENTYSVNKKAFFPVLMEFETYGTLAAQTIVANRINLLRAVLNISEDIRLNWWYSAAASPISKILESPVYVVYQDNESPEIFLHIPVGDYQYKVHSPDTKTIEFAKGLLKDFKDSEEGDIKNLIMQLMIQYQQAFDLSFSNLIYLALWQVLERATLNDPAKKSQIEARVITLLGLNGKRIWENGISLINETRNKLVHDGVFPDYAEDLLFSLKGIVDGIILRLLELSKPLETVEKLGEFFQLATKPNNSLRIEKEQLEVKRSVIDFIENSRI
ncbi:MAG: hypothetical protein H6652_24905 [Ardenticatenaceae bacterium]|nr:hypothetical protein [Ardenticatenaceae bacterium]